jgi:CRP/FNR family cyclic AMP-dependent transcriptional regulator
MSDPRAFISTLPETRHAYLAELFRNLPAGMESMFALRRTKAGDTLARRQDEASTVYILLEGSIRVLDEHYSGEVYAFAEFEAPSLFGEFEAFAGCGRYRATLACATDCALFSLPAAAFLEWMRRDPTALYMRTVQITKKLLGQASNERRFRFASAGDRLLLYLTEAYRTGERRGVCRLAVKRQDIADQTGYCLKTVQRCLAALRKRGLISAEGAKIVVDAEQYRRLVALSPAGIGKAGIAAENADNEENIV